MFDDYYAVIMAGGGGTRLWPLSRQARPKQLLKIGRRESMFQVAVNRLAGLFPLERILVVTTAEQATALQAQTPDIPQENFLLEPMPRGTAAVVALATAALQARTPDAVMAILTADHFIADEGRFRQLLTAAYQVARSGYLATLGITPTYPATGYGYIQAGASLGRFETIPAFKAVRFKEKPSEEAARTMLSGGDHTWNSGMFIWQVKDISAEFARQMPDLHNRLREIAGAWNTAGRAETIAGWWPGIKPETIDYGIMEGAQQVAVLPATGLGWNDVGSWESLYDVLPQDEAGNVVQGANTLLMESRGTLVFTENNQPERMIVALGTEDLIIVDTGDVLLVCPKGQAQQIRQVVAALKQSNRHLT